MLIYADDVVLIADNEATLQDMLNVVASFGNEFSLSFNSKKCGVLIVNKPELGRENFSIGNVVINRVREYNYLGVVFNEMGTGKAKMERIFRAIQWWGRLGSITNFRSNKYEVVRGVWKVIAVPGILYGMNTMNWSLEETKKIEVVQNKIGRLGLGANMLVGIEAIRGDMGWSSFEERLFKGKLKFKVRLENMDGNRWARKIYIETGTKSKFSMDCVRVANKCGFSRKWVAHGDSNAREWRLDIQEEDAANFDENKWKRVINRKVQGYGLAKWRNGIESKVSLGLYAIKPQPKMEFFFDGNWASTLLFKARSNSMEINDRTYRFNEGRIRECEMCRNGIIDGAFETTIHLIAECEAYDNARGRAMEQYIDIMGRDWFDEVVSADDSGLSHFLGLVLGTPLEVVNVTKSLLSNIWRVRTLGNILTRE